MAYPDAPDFASSARDAAWYTNTAERQVCTTGAGNFLRDLNTRLNAVFGASASSANTWRFIAANTVSAGAGPLASLITQALGSRGYVTIPTGPVWEPETFAHLYLAMRQWYGDANPYVRQIAAAYRAGTITPAVLQAAAWFTYHTRNGVAEVRPDGGRGPSSSPPSELTPLAAIEVKGNAVPPVAGRTLTVLAGSRACEDLPDRDPSVIQDGAVQIAGTQVSFVTIGVAAVAVGAAVWWLVSQRGQ